jgi:cytochrome c551/c552
VRRVLVAFALSLLAFGSAAQQGRPPSAAQGERARHLAGDRGCTVCHRERPAPLEAGASLPLAPSWSEIAVRYTGRKDAEDRLAGIVVGGADPADRHWKIRVDFTAMGANAPRVSPDEARALVRWILSAP